VSEPPDGTARGSREDLTGASARAERIRAGDVRVAALLMRDIDDGLPEAELVLRLLYPHTGRAAVVGITGPPGAGKSTLVDALVTLHRKRGSRVGVVAVDPTSSFTGGAVLGDRVRMQRHAVDDGVFIRSLATRGQLGGLSRAAADVVDVLDAMGMDLVIVETVGVGQDEVDIAALADAVVVVMVPGLGDEVQALKAGLLEIADVFVVNKADREGADRAVRDLAGMLSLPEERRATPDPEILKVVATTGEGVAALAEALDRLREQEQRSGAFEQRRLRQAEARLTALLRDRLRRQAERALEAFGGRQALAAQVAARSLDPYSAVARLLPGLP
jgi:LAO/AO transport system kinase